MQICKKIMKIFEFIACFFVVTCLVKCQKIYHEEDLVTIGTFYESYNNKSSTQNRQSTHDASTSTSNQEKLISKCIYDTTSDLFKASQILNEIATGDTFILSPVAVIGALAVVLLGSIGNTHHELVQFFHLSSIPNIETDPLSVYEHIGNLLKKIETSFDPEVINYAVSIFYQSNFLIRPKFTEISQRVYNTELQAIDFQRQPIKSQQQINHWVSQKTQGKITQLVSSPLPSDTNVIITSVLYFQADWEHPFDEQYTRLQHFYSNGKNNPSDGIAAMMFTVGEFPYIRHDVYDLQMMGFPYKGNRFTLYVVVDNTTRNNISRIEHALTEEYINYLIDHTSPIDSEIRLPKIELETTVNLKPLMQSLGVSELFHAKVSNLALMSGNSDYKNVSQFDKNSDSLQKLKVIRQQLEKSSVNPELHVDQIIHKVHLDIRERGSKTATAANFIINQLQISNRLVFQVDVPFVFFIYDKTTKTRLMQGSVKSFPPKTS